MGAQVSEVHLAECDGHGWVVCWRCGGATGSHDCGEDTCACADPEAITEDCEACDGTGRIECPACGGDDGGKAEYDNPEVDVRSPGQRPSP